MTRSWKQKCINNDIDTELLRRSSKADNFCHCVYSYKSYNSNNVLIPLSNNNENKNVCRPRLHYERR